MAFSVLQWMLSILCRFWSWFVDSETTGVVTWVGTALGLYAIYLTYRQAEDAAAKAMDAKIAAESASLAASKAVAALRSKISLSTLVYSHAQIGVVKNLLQSSDIQAARIVFHPLGRSVSEICSYFNRITSMQDGVKVVRRNMKAVEFQFGLLIQKSPKADMAKVEMALNGIAGFLADAENYLKYGDGNVEDVI